MVTKDGDIIDRREMLKVKCKTLAQEARIIRRYEQRMKNFKPATVMREEMHNHRVCELRREARSSHLAFGFIRGRTIDQMENKRKSEPNVKRVNELLKKYGPQGAQLSPDLIYSDMRIRVAV